MNQLNTAKRCQIIAALVEGNSINATCRMLGVGKHTVLRLLEDAGCACAAYHDAVVRGLEVKRIQCDEIWAFVLGKDKNLTLEQVQAGFGSVWTWTAIDADSKLIVSYMLGDRGADAAHTFMRDVASRISNRIQLTTDGHRVYAEAVEDAFGSEVDYAMLVKIRGIERKPRIALQPRNLYRMPNWSVERHARPKIHLYQLCGTSEPFHENGNAPIHAANERPQ
jgi:IS1 family transposase